MIGGVAGGTLESSAGLAGATSSSGESGAVAVCGGCCDDAEGWGGGFTAAEE